MGGEREAWSEGERGGGEGGREAGAERLEGGRHGVR